jgi:hypothetical protein
MSKLQAACLLLFVLIIGSVWGQTPTQTPSQPAQTPPSQQTQAAPSAPSATTASPEALKAASELVEVMNLQATFDEGKDAMIKAQMQSNPALKQYEDLMRQFVDKYLTWDQVKDQYVNIYANMFTESELRELIQLYQTPTGKKLLTSMPEIMNQSLQITQRQLQPHLPELQKQIMARVQEQQKQKQQAQPGQGQPGQAQPGEPGQQQTPSEPQPGHQQPQPKPQTPPQ